MTLTVRELINRLINYDVGEEIEIVDKDGYMYKIVDFGGYTDLPYFVIEKDS